jgi:signal transduction histidine kinase
MVAPGLLAAEAITRGYEQLLVADAHTRTANGLDSVTGMVDVERIRVLNNAEVAGERLGPLVASNVPPGDLLKAVADVRTNALRSTSLLAVIDGSGRIVASDPASNVPFGTSGDVKNALEGRLASAVLARGGLVLEGASPLRNSGPMPGAAVVVTNVDDAFLNTALRVSGLNVAVVNEGRVIAASRDIRRSISFTGETGVDQDLANPSGDLFKRTRLGAEDFYVSARAIGQPTPKPIATSLVGLPASLIDEGVRRVRLLALGAALLGGTGAGLAGGILGSRAARRVRRAETDALRLSSVQSRADHFQAVLDSLNEGVIVADANRRVMLVNPAARGLLSLPAGGDSEAPVFTDQLLPASERVIRSYSAPVRDDAGQLLGTVTVLRDTTRDQELERLKSEFLTVVSHELQTPLTAIKGALELVMDDDTGQLSRVQRRFLETIERNCGRLVSLVGDLLDLSRLEAGRIELESQPLDTTSVVRGAVSAVSNLFEARGTALNVDVSEALPPILGDRRRVEQILTNLLANAAKYTPAGGVVEVAAHTRNGHVALSVTDNGPGVPESERDIVFDKFYRGREAQQRGEAGSGLGLAIVKSLVELHEGSVRVEAGEPRGARFVVELPRATDDE